MELDVNAYYQEHVDQALSGKYSVHGDPAAVDCVIAAAFGYREHESTVSPGLSNEWLAAFIAERYAKLPKILQFEIADAYQATHSRDITVERITEATDPAQRLDTPEFIQQAKRIMGRHGWQQAVVVAHPNHLPWVDFLCGQIGISTVAPAGLQEAPFDPRSAQYWTRSLTAWQQEVSARHGAGDPRSPIKDA